MSDRCFIQNGARARLRILATTDLHMHLTSYDYYADRPDPTVGLTRTATLIHLARAEAETDGILTLLFDNGDGLQGTPLGDIAISKSNALHPLMRAFKYLEYDAVGLGNHDFNYGLRRLDVVLQQSPCPVLCSNMRHTNNAQSANFRPYAILDRSIQCADKQLPIRIGVMSLLPPQTVKWDAHHLQDVVAIDGIVETARKLLSELRAAGCDLVVALAHTGLSGTPNHHDLENAALPLAALDGIDVVVSGHTHLCLPGPDHKDLDDVDPKTGSAHGKPIVMAGTAGAYLGVIDLELCANENHLWDSSRFTCELRPIARRTTSGHIEPLANEDPGLVQLLAGDHVRTRTVLDEPAGYSTTSLHSYFSFFAPDRALALVAAAQADALGPLLTGTSAAGLPILSAVAPGKFGARAGPENYTDIPAGRLSMRNIADLHVFPNQLCAAIVTGKQVVDWLEMSARLFHQIVPGLTGQTLTNPAVPGHDFDVLHGLTYQIDLSEPARYHHDGTQNTTGKGRIRRVACNGNLVRPTDRFVVALNSYRASGGGPFDIPHNSERISIPAISLHDLIRDYIAAQKNVAPALTMPPPWRFKSLRGTAVTALTGPGARKHLGELCGRGIVEDGLTPNGFLRLMIPL